MTLVAPLLELGTFALVLWVIATALAIALIMRVIGDVFRHIPVVGGPIAGAVEAGAQAISNACGKLEHGVDKLVGASWHQLARYMDRWLHHFEEQATLMLTMAEIALGLKHAHVKTRAMVHKAVGSVGHITPRVKRLEREWHGIEHGIKSLERELTKGIGHDLRIHVKALEREIGRVVHRDIPTIRSRAKAAEIDLTALREWVKNNALVAGTAAFAGAVAWALGRLGLGGLRCNSLRNNMDKRGCSMWGAMDDLLGLVALGIAAGEFEELVHEAQELTDFAVTAFDEVFGLSR